MFSKSASTNTSSCLAVSSTPKSDVVMTRSSSQSKQAIPGLDTEKMRRIALFAIRLKCSRGAAKDSERAMRVSSESTPERVDVDSNGSERRKSEGTEQRPGTAPCQLSSQLRSAVANEERKIAEGDKAEGRGGQDGPRTMQTTSRVLSGDSDDEKNRNERSEPDEKHGVSTKVLPLHTGRAAEKKEWRSQARSSGPPASPVAVSRQRQENPAATNEPKVSFSRDLCSTPGLHRCAVDSPVQHDVLASPASLPLPVRGGETCVGGNRTDAVPLVDEARPQAFRDGSGGNDRNESASFTFRPGSPTHSRTNDLTDPWRAGVRNEQSSTVASKRAPERSTTISPTEMKSSNNEGVDGGVDLSWRRSERELTDFWRAAPMVARRCSVTRDRWCARILAEAAATIANSRGMRGSTTLVPDEAKRTRGHVGACDGVRTGDEFVATRLRMTEPKTGDGFSQNLSPADLHAEKSQLIAGSVQKSAAAPYPRPMDDALTKDVHEGCREASPLEQASSTSRTSPAMPAVAPCSVRDLWSTRILREAAATLASHGVRTSPMHPRVETICGISPRIQGDSRHRARTREVSLDGARGSALGGSRQCLQLSKAESLDGGHSSPIGSRAQRLSLPIDHGKIRSPIATVLGRWTFSGSEGSSETPLIVDVGCLCPDGPTKCRLWNGGSTTGACASGKGMDTTELIADASSTGSSHKCPLSGQQRIDSDEKGGYRKEPSRPPQTGHPHDSIVIRASSADVARDTSADGGAASRGKNVFLRVRNQTREFCETFWARDGRTDDGRTNPGGGPILGGRERPALPIVLSKDSKVSITAALRRWSFSGLHRSPSQLPIIVDSGSVGLDV